IGTITLTGQAPVDTVITLSSNSAHAVVPSSVTIAAGSTSANFNIDVYPASSIVSATITATLGSASLSRVLTIDPPSLLSVTATASNSTQVVVSWNSVSGASTYTLTRSTGSGYSNLASGLTVTSYTDSSISDGVQYQYQVIAYDGSGNQVAIS